MYCLSSLGFFVCIYAIVLTILFHSPCLCYAALHGTCSYVSLRDPPLEKWLGGDFSLQELFFLPIACAAFFIFFCRRLYFFSLPSSLHNFFLSFLLAWIFLVYPPPPHHFSSGGSLMSQGPDDVVEITTKCCQHIQLVFVSK